MVKAIQTMIHVSVTVLLTFEWFHYGSEWLEIGTLNHTLSDELVSDRVIRSVKRAQRATPIGSETQDR